MPWKDRAKLYASNRAYYAKNKEKFKAWRAKAHMLKKYGISVSDYDAMLERQNGRCAICGRTDSYGGRKLAVDHCHSTGRVRGLLCTGCNAGLGSFLDNPALLMSAKDYLAKY